MDAILALYLYGIGFACLAVSIVLFTIALFTAGKE